MSNLMRIRNTMTSLELVKLINDFRKEEGDKRVLRHSNLKLSIKRDFEGMLPEKYTYINPQNKVEYQIINIRL